MDMLPQSVLMPGSSVNYTQDRRTLALSNQLVGLLLANDRHFTEAIRMLGIRYVLLRNDIVARGFPFEPSIYERAIARECGRPHCILRTIGDLELADFGTPNGAFVLSDSWLVDGSSRLDPGVSLLLAAHYGDVARLPDPTGKQRDVFDERRRDLKGSTSGTPRTVNALNGPVSSSTSKPQADATQGWVSVAQALSVIFANVPTPQVVVEVPVETAKTSQAYPQVTLDGFAYTRSVAGVQSRSLASYRRDRAPSNSQSVTTWSSRSIDASWLCRGERFFPLAKALSARACYRALRSVAGRSGCRISGLRWRRFRPVPSRMSC